MATTVRDDRGRRITGVTLSQKRVALRSRGGRVFTFRTEPIDPAGRSAYLRREARAWAGFLTRRRLLELLGGFAIVLIAAALLIGRGRPGPDDWVWGAVWAGVITGAALLIGGAMAWHARRRSPRLIADLPVVCAACTYDLAGLAPEPDGCTVCPECGAAWRLEPAATDADPGAGGT